MFSIPHAFTMARILSVPLVVHLIREGEWTAFPVFVLAAGTDWFDGWLARRLRQVTRLGAFLDVLADKLLVMSALVSLVEVGVVPAWMVVAILTREFAVSSLRGFALKHGVEIKVEMWGKVKMWVQSTCVAFLLTVNIDQLAFVAEYMHLLGRVLLWLMLLATAASGILYFVSRGARRVFLSPNPD